MAVYQLVSDGGLVCQGEWSLEVTPMTGDKYKDFKKTT